MIHWPALFSGLGLIHYWSVGESFRQYYRLVSKKLLFDTLSYAWVLTLGADFACLLAWMLGLSAPDDGSLLEVYVIILAPLPFIVLTVFSLFKHGKVQPNSAVDQYFKKVPFNATNLSFFIAASLFMFFMIYITYSSFSEGQACGNIRCQVYGWFFGSKNKIFGGLTLGSLGMSFLFGGALLAALGWLEKARLRTNGHADE